MIQDEVFSIFLSDSYLDGEQSSNIILGGSDLVAFATDSNSKFEFLKVDTTYGYWLTSLDFAEINENNHSIDV